MRGTIFEGSSPQKYQDWLSGLGENEQKRSGSSAKASLPSMPERVAEAAYLEPDVVLWFRHI
jgi:hypothetical protein